MYQCSLHVMEVVESAQLLSIWWQPDECLGNYATYPPLASKYSLLGVFYRKIFEFFL